MNRLLTACALICVTGLAQALPGDAPRDAERASIASERAAANARFNERQRVCQTRFVVTSCVDAARKEQSATLSGLKARELQLVDDQRREAESARRQEMAERAGTQTGRASDPASSVRSVDKPHRPPEPNPPAAAHHELGHQPTGARNMSTAERQAAEQRSSAELEAKKRAIDEHREAVKRRNAQRAAAGKAAPPLPLPPGASAP